MAENKQKFHAFVGPSNPLRVARYDCERTVNMYLEQSPLGAGKEQEPAVLAGRAGLTLLTEQDTGPIRAVYHCSISDIAYFVSGQGVYRIAALGSIPVHIGNLLTLTGYVSVSDNGQYVVFVDGQFGYTTDMTGTVLTQISDVHFYSSSQVTYQDTFFIFTQTNTNQIFYAETDPTTKVLVFNALNWAVKSGSSDKVVGIISNNRQLYIFGEHSTEVWWDNGGTQFPFARQDGKFSQVGCLGQATIARLFNTVMWLGSSPEGSAIIYQMQNDQPVRVSNHAVEFSLQQLKTDLIYATAYSYQVEGHYFYLLNCANLNTTWVYDLSNDQWVEYQSYDGETLGRYLGQYHAYFNGTHLIGDYRNGRIYILNPTEYTDNGEPIVRVRQSPHVSSSYNRMFYSLMEIDFTPGTATMQSPARITLEISNDGGITFGNPIFASIGKSGAYLARARWQRLGSSRDRVFRVSCSDPIKFNILGAALDVEIGNA
jgi:hypothetical protein